MYARTVVEAFAEFVSVARKRLREGQLSQVAGSLTFYHRTGAGADSDGCTGHIHGVPSCLILSGLRWKPISSRI
jgi:hypothetical protein